MPDPLPYAAEADAEISHAELKVLEDAYARAVRVSGPDRVPSQIKFNYAWGLIRSRRRMEQKKGLDMLRDIYLNDPERQRECMYYLALGYYRIGDYQASRKFNEELLKFEPHNLQAQSLRQLINDRVSQDGIVGMAIVGGVVAAASMVLAAVLKRK